MLTDNPEAFVFACDFSETAIQCLQKNERYKDDRVQAFVADITADALTRSIPTASIDLCTMIFVLSALSPASMQKARLILECAVHCIS